MTEAKTETALPLASGFAPATHDQWLKLVSKVLGGAPFDAGLLSRTHDGIAVEPLYTRPDPSEVRGLDLGRYPGWEMSQLHAEPDPASANAAIREDVENGAAAVTLRIEAYGQSGLPPRHAAIAAALEGIPLDRVRIALGAGDNTLEAAAALLALWRSQETPVDERKAALNADPLGDIARTGALSHPLERAVTLAARFAVDPVWRDHPALTLLLADGRPYHEAGGSEAQELAGMLSALVAYLRACEQEGLGPERAFPRIALALAADADVFLTIAKLRAARLLVSRVAEACGAGAVAGSMRLTASTSERMMARRDPWVNMLRTAAACTGAVFGGADTVTVLPFTWALGRPDAFARRIARNTQLVLKEEAALGRVADPGHGSWYVEKLTQDLAERAWGLFQEIEAAGGMAAALRSGVMRDKVAEVAAARDRAITAGDEQLTGVSAFPRLGDDGARFEPHPIVAPIDKAHQQIRPLTARRLAAPFEALRDAADGHRTRTARPPKVFLACLGTPAEHGARAAWVRNFLAAGGIEAEGGDGFSTTEAAVAAFKACGATVACVCASDHVYEAFGVEAVRAVKATGARQVSIAGQPRKLEAGLRAAGADAFLFDGIDAVATLRRLHEVLDVRSD